MGLGRCFPSPKKQFSGSTAVLLGGPYCFFEQICTAKKWMLEKVGEVGQDLGKHPS